MGDFFFFLILFTERCNRCVSHNPRSELKKKKKIIKSALSDDITTGRIKSYLRGPLFLTSKSSVKTHISPFLTGPVPWFMPFYSLLKWEKVWSPLPF